MPPRDLDGVAGGLGARAQALRVVRSSPRLIQSALIVSPSNSSSKVGLAPRVAGQRGAGGRVEPVAPGRGDAVRRPRAQAVGRQEELHATVGVLLGGRLLLPGTVGADLEHRLRGPRQPVRRSRRRRRRHRRWTRGPARAGRSGGAGSRPPSGARSGRTGGTRTRRPPRARRRPARWSAWLPWTSPGSWHRAPGADQSGAPRACACRAAIAWVASPVVSRRARPPRARRWRAPRA